MTTFSVKAQVTAAGIEPVDTVRMARHKVALKPGELIRITFEPWHDKRSDEAFRLFHVYVGRYAKKQLLDMYWAKHQLKRLWGVTVRYNPENFKLPTRGGKFIELDGEIHFHITTLEYRKGEMNYLIEGARQSCIDVGADIEDLEEKDDSSI